MPRKGNSYAKCQIRPHLLNVYMCTKLFSKIMGVGISWNHLGQFMGVGTAWDSLWELELLGALSGSWNYLKHAMGAGTNLVTLMRV